MNCDPSVTLIPNRIFAKPYDSRPFRMHVRSKNALRIGRQGEIRDRTAEGQHYRMAGLNLLAAIIIYWNTKHLGQAVAARQRAGLNCDPALLAHISPLGWAHILLTGEYRWRRQAGTKT